MVTNLSETTLGMSGKLRRISNRKRNHLFFYSTCLRVLFCARRLKIDANVTNFAGWLPLRRFHSSI